MKKTIIISLLTRLFNFNKTKPLSIKVNDTFYTLSYKLIKNDSDDIYIIFNGITRGMYILNNIINKLSVKNSSILVFDYFGRGASDFVPVRHTEEFYTNTIKYMLDKILPSNKKIHLMGYSLGCAVITALLYNNSIPNVVSVTYICPTGFMLPLTKWESRFIALPFSLLFNIIYVLRDSERVYGKQENFNNRIDKLVWMSPKEQLNYKTQYSIDRNSKKQLKSVLLTVKEKWFFNNEDKYKTVLQNYSDVTFKVFYGMDDKVIVKEDVEERMKSALSNFSNITYIKVIGTPELPADHEMIISYPGYIINNL